MTSQNERRRYKKWPAEAVDRVAELRELKWSASEIADEFGVTIGAIESLCQKHGIPSPYDRAAPRGSYKEEAFDVGKAIDLHLQDIELAHGPDKRWDSYDIRRESPQHIGVYASNNMSVAGSPMAMCLAAAGTD